MDSNTSVTSYLDMTAVHPKISFAWFDVGLQRWCRKCWVCGEVAYFSRIMNTWWKLRHKNECRIKQLSLVMGVYDYQVVVS
jgi:hypothetical protein